jgi:hypothetical protein
VERALSPVRRGIRTRLRGSGVAGFYRFLTTLLVFHLVLVSWVFFRAGNLPDGLTVLSRIWWALPDLPGLLVRYPFTPEHAFLASLIVGLLAIELVMESKRRRQRLARAPRPIRWIAIYAGLFSLLLLGRWQGEAFVYMQF